MGKSTGSGYRVWPELAADPELLDEPIRPLIGALNATGWARTVFSCAGHPDEPDSTQKGRRQAHIDLVVSDLPGWSTFVAKVQRSARGVRVTEGSLGPLPSWLADQPGFGGAAPAGPGEARQDQLGVQGSAASLGRRSLSWHYRRLVFEPAPYDMPPERCRLVLDSALSSATSILQSPDPHTSRADTH